MSITKNGISTTKSNDSFQYEEFHTTLNNLTKYQWDYRDINGILHSGISPSIQDAINNAKSFGYKG